MALVSTEQTAAGYDCLAPYYDHFTAGYAYDHWVDGIEQRAMALGLTGRRVLDLACGTGKSSGPFLARGYSLRGCDISPAMIREARRKFPGSADAFVVGDMQAPPWLGEFDLVVCLDDAINYLLGEDELEAAFAGVATMLAPEGVFAFDVNSLYTYRTAFAQTFVREQDGLLFIWRGEAAGGFESGDIATASVDVFAGRRHLRWERCSMQHVQRHHPAGAIVAALSRAGLGCKAIVGQYPGAELVDGADDEVHTKLVYFAGHQEGR